MSFLLPPAATFSQIGTILAHSVKKEMGGKDRKLLFFLPLKNEEF